MSLDRLKVQVVREWPMPTNATEVRQALHLNYRQYIHKSANIVKPLNALMQKNTSFNNYWCSKCEASFNTLKHKLN